MNLFQQSRCRCVYKSLNKKKEKAKTPCRFYNSAPKQMRESIDRKEKQDAKRRQKPENNRGVNFLPHHVENLLLQLLALELEVLDRLHKQFIAVPLAGALYRKDEVVPAAAELDLAVKLGVAQALAADGILHGILHDGAQLADVVL